MSYYIAKLEDGKWSLGPSIQKSRDALNQYQSLAYLEGVKNVMLLMDRGVHTEVSQATFINPLDWEREK